MSLAHGLALGSRSLRFVIVGVGAARRVSAVRWGLAGNIVWAWIITIPIAGAIAAVTYWLTAALT